jgi:hypothetical protein
MYYTTMPRLSIKRQRRESHTIELTERVQRGRLVVRHLLKRFPFSAIFALAAISGCDEPPSPAGRHDAGASNQSAPAASTGTASAVSEPPAAAPSDEQVATWLAGDLPPLVDGAAAPPVKLSAPKIEPNEFGQEILTAEYERPAVVRTVAADLELVLLSGTGGRESVYVNPGLLIQPQNAGQIHGITQNLIDYRGRLRSGMRAYLEMRPAAVNPAAAKPARVSNVVWLGTEEQLLGAMKQGQPPPAKKTATSEPALHEIPAGKIEKGTPLWMRCGDRWARGYALEDADGERIKLLIYLVRRDKPYLPWVADLPRQDLRIEQEALREFKHDPHSFHDLADANDAKLSRHGSPNRLEHVDAANLPVGTAVLEFWNGMLDPCRTTAPIKDGSIAIQRVGLDNAQMTKPAADLFLDPFAATEASKK